jgi:glycerol-3-phosphate acyltransferase PlsX
MTPRRRPRLGLDAFGSDFRPQTELEAARRAAQAGLELELIGDAATLEPALASDPTTSITVVHAPSQIAMDESPARAVRGKPDASMCVAIDRLARRDLDAVVSAGNSGALLAAALLGLGRLPGLDRPAIATSFPRIDGGRTVLLDAGANIDCKPLNLVQFAVVGAAFSSSEAGFHGPLGSSGPAGPAGLARPRVAVLANGVEASKGTRLTRGAHEILSQWQARRGGASAFEFAGYVEPGELFTAACDVAVTDGWTGNIALKLAEGAMGAWPRLLERALTDVQGEDVITDVIAPALQAVARRVDPDAYGGAPLLGVDGVVMICHGSAGPMALLAALHSAHRFAERDLTRTIGQALEDHAELFELARSAASHDRANRE